MAGTDYKFRYLLQPGSNFQFVAKFRFWLILSVVLLVASIATLLFNKQVRGDYMNWSIDFRGGTETYYAFRDKADPSKRVTPDIHQIRAALKESAGEGFDVSDVSWTDATDVEVHGAIVRSPHFGAVAHDKAAKVVEQVNAKLAAKQIEKASWSGDRLMIRSRTPLAETDVAPLLTEAGLEMKPWTPDEAKAHATPDEGTGEYNATFSVWGLDRQYERVLESKMSNVDVEVIQSYGIGAKAGDKLRNDAAKSLFYAMFLIMLYLAFRFDIRYAPGAAFATIHDAVMVIGVFAITWTEVSLTTVAALLTVVGYSVNDTVIIFDRIRENAAKLKDKRIERVIDVSLNEVLARSILTSLTVFATTLIMNIFGDGLVRNFAFAMNIGVIVGTYSSLFLAPPIFLWVQHRWYTSSTSTRRARADAVAAEP